MRILYTHYLNDPDHPAAKMVSRIALQLKELGHTTHVHGCDINSSFSFEPIPNSHPQSRFCLKRKLQTTVKQLKSWLWFAKAMGRNKFWKPAVHQAIDTFQPDIILSRQDAYCWAAVEAALESKIPVVTYADAPVSYETRKFSDIKRWHPPGMLEKIERWGLSHSKAVITVSYPAKKLLERLTGKTPIHVIPNGVDAEWFQSILPKDRLEIRRALGVEGKTVIGFQGTFKSFHGTDRLTQLIETTKDRDDVTWLLIGDGPEKKSVQDGITATNVKFLGRRNPDEMSLLLSAVDIAVAPHAQMPGEFYFCPLKILEYAASGCAILASNQGDIPRLLSNGEGGMIVESDRIEDWKSGLFQLIENRKLRKSFGDIAKQFTIENFTWKKTAQNVEAVLYEALETTPPKLVASTNPSPAVELR